MWWHYRSRLWWVQLWWIHGNYLCWSGNLSTLLWSGLLFVSHILKVSCNLNISGWWKMSRCSPCRLWWSWSLRDFFIYIYIFNNINIYNNIANIHHHILWCWGSGCQNSNYYDIFVSNHNSVSQFFNFLFLKLIIKQTQFRWIWG